MRADAPAGSAVPSVVFLELAGRRLAVEGVPRPSLEIGARILFERLPFLEVGAEVPEIGASETTGT